MRFRFSKRNSTSCICYLVILVTIFLVVFNQVDNLKASSSTLYFSSDFSSVEKKAFIKRPGNNPEDPRSDVNINIIQKSKPDFKSSESHVDVEESRAFLKKTGAKTSIIIYSEGRSGSTWLSSFFRTRPNVFYVFEPLYNTFPFQDRGCHDNSTARKACHEEVLSNLFTCNFHTSKLSVLGRYPFYRRKPCPMSQLEKICRGGTHIIAKVVHMYDLRDIDRLMQNIPNLKVIHLVRDPRPLIKSRANQLFGGIVGVHKYTKENKYTDETYSAESKVLCDRILRACKLGDNPPEWLNERYIRITHEDLSLNTVTIAKKLYAFVDLPWDMEIEEWIYNSTVGLIKEKPNGFFSVNRISSEEVFSWRKTMNKNAVELVNEACGDVLEYLKYHV